MGCLVAIECEASDEATALAAVADGWAAIERVVRLMDPAAPASDLALINAAPAGTVLRVDPWTTQLLRLSRRLCRGSGGLFDPALPGHGSVRSLVDLRDRGWRLREALQLDFGGIAKGFAVDRALQAMRARGARAGLVNAGGDLRLFGRNLRALRLRRAGIAQRAIALRSGALALSEPGNAGAPPAHRGYYRGNFGGFSCDSTASPGRAVRAQRDPRALPAMAVLARDCARADAMTKVLLQARGAQRRRLARLAGVRCLAL
jgi:thiamine biosynthesis lipoprotein